VQFITLCAVLCFLFFVDEGANMHSATIAYLTLLISPFGQVGDYNGGYAQPENTGEMPRYTVTDAARTRSTRAVANQPLGAYPAERVASQPRYAEDPNRTYPPTQNEARPGVPEDPQSLLAAKLLRDMIQPTHTQTREQVLSLYDTLARTSGAQQQFEAVKAYWKWNLSVAELHGVLEEDAMLARVQAPRTTHEQRMHEATRHAAVARVEDTRLDVASKFVELEQVTGVNTNVAMRPTDVPFVSAYNTNYQRIFANGTAPSSIRKIHQTLPFVLKVVRTRADALAASRQALGAAETAYQSGQMSYGDLLDTITLLRNQRRAFLDSVHDYNFAIAEYALTAAGPGVSRETVVSMLIRTHTTNTPYRGAAYYPNEIRTVSVDELVDVRHYDASLIPVVR
jgi:hypothetical protein